MYYDTNDKEVDCLVSLFQSYRTMIDVLGWQQIQHAPVNTRLWLIELGSTGVHEGWKNGNKFYITDGGETYNSHPILFKLKG